MKVPKGTDWLGGWSGEQGATKVDIEQDFYLGKFEVSQEEWEAVTGLDEYFAARPNQHCLSKRNSADREGGILRREYAGIA